MHAAILSIGDELTLGESLDTNSRWLASQLYERSIIVREHRTIPDARSLIADFVGELARGGPILIFLTGGLGPTEDDLTREGLGDLLTPGEPLVQDGQALKWLDEWFANRGRTMPPSNLSQTYRPRTMRCIPNAHGTAPGMTGTHLDCTIYALPGPPSEMKPMFLEHIVPQLPTPRAGSITLMRKVNLFGLGESLAAQRLGETLNRERRPQVGITVSEAIISARVRDLGVADELESRIEADLERIEQLWHPYAFSRDDETLAQVIGQLLTAQRRTLATAESCTGGWLGKAIVDVAGSSAYYLGGWVTYSNEMKSSQLGVDQALIAAHGAVSGEVAKVMAEGARQRSGADYAVAITGVAGPDGSPEKPAGLVYIALAQPDRATSVRCFNFVGDREAVRDRSVKAAMQMLRFALIGVADDVPLIWQSGCKEPIGRI